MLRSGHDWFPLFSSKTVSFKGWGEVPSVSGRLFFSNFSSRQLVVHCCVPLAQGPKPTISHWKKVGPGAKCHYKPIGSPPPEMKHGYQGVCGWYPSHPASTVPSLQYTWKGITKVPPSICKSKPQKLTPPAMLISWHRFRRGLDPNTHVFKAWDETHDIPPPHPQTKPTPNKNKTGMAFRCGILNSSDFFYWFPLLENAQKESTPSTWLDRFSPSSLVPDPLTEQLLGSNVVPRFWVGHFRDRNATPSLPGFGQRVFL